MRRIRRYSVCAAFCAAIALASAAQSPTATPVSELITAATWPQPNSTPAAPYTFRSRVQEASVRFHAVDSKGAPVNGLERSDVRILDDREPVSEVKGFSRVEHRRLLVGVVVDLSESIRPDQQLDMLNILDALTGRLDVKQDRAFLVGFSNQVKVLQAPTSDLALVRKSLQEHPTQSGLTSLFDAIVTTCRDPFESTATEQQRIMILFSDGLDTLSIHGLNDAIEAAVRAKVSVYTIATLGTTQRGSYVLEKLAHQTGGKAYVVGKKHDVATAIAGVTQPALDEYAVTFRPASTRTGLHSVELQLRSGRAVLLQSGYVLEPE